MRFGSLFSGIGGLDLGLERAGMECAWQVEIDEWCRAVLARHWPDVPRWDDAKTFPPSDANGQRREVVGNTDTGNGEPLAAETGEPAGVGRQRDVWGVDLIAGGFPCQPVSLAGKRRGQDDERWLWPEFARIVRLLRPRYVLVENVPGLLARGMGDVLGDLAASGYDCEWDCIPAAAVGAPHLRYRVFIVAHASGDLRRASGDERFEPSDGTRLTPNADGGGLEGERSGGLLDREWPAFGNDAYGRRSAVAHAENTIRRSNGGRTPGRPPRQLGGIGRGIGPISDWWTTEPDVGRVAHGVPSRVDRLRGLGNAVVPQVAEWIGRRLMEMDA